MQQRWADEAGWVLVDPELEWTINKDTIVSNGKNTPLIQHTVKGKVLQAFYAV